MENPAPLSVDSASRARGITGRLRKNSRFSNSLCNCSRCSGVHVSMFSEVMCFLVRNTRCCRREKRTSCWTISPITPSKSHPTAVTGSFRILHSGNLLARAHFSPVDIEADMQQQTKQHRSPWPPAKPPTILKIQEADENAKRVYQSHQEKEPTACARIFVVGRNSFVGGKRTVFSCRPRYSFGGCPPSTALQCRVPRQKMLNAK